MSLPTDGYTFQRVDFGLNAYPNGLSTGVNIQGSISYQYGTETEIEDVLAIIESALFDLASNLPNGTFSKECVGTIDTQIYPAP